MIQENKEHVKLRHTTFSLSTHRYNSLQCYLSFFPLLEILQSNLNTFQEILELIVFCFDKVCIERGSWEIFF